jgi:predicted metal-dependent hydrolase
MIKSKQKVKELIEILNLDNNIVITEAIELLRLEKPFEEAIGLLTSFYDKTNDRSVRKSIAGFMNDLKDQSACVEVIKEIRKEWKPDTISMLVSSCWQSGLNYSDFSIDLAKVFLQGDYVTAIECLTVIEESVQEMSEEKRNEVIKLIEENPFPRADEKSTLTLELISILER